MKIRGVMQRVVLGDIVVEVLEGDRGKIVNIEGESQEVLVNGEVVYNSVKKKEYKYIPKHIIPFIEEHEPHFEGVSEDKKLRFYIVINGREYLGLVPINKNGNSSITLRSWLINYKKLDLTMQNEEKEEKRQKQLLNSIKKKGYKLVTSHGGDAYDDWVDLIIPLKSFDKKKVTECINYWDTYNDKLITKYIGK